MFSFIPFSQIKIGVFGISVHGLLLAAGFVVGLLIARREAKKAGISADLLDNAALVGAIAGLIGARIVFVAIFGREMTVLQMLEIWKGGLSSHGGYIFGLGAAFAYLHWKKADLRKFADAVFPAFLVGWAIGRIGCFLNWDSYGKITESGWGIRVNGITRYPTQLFETFGYLATFGILKLLKRLPHPFGSAQGRPTFLRMERGEEGATALFVFAFLRFVIDFWRDDGEGYMILSRAVSIAVMAGAAAFVVWNRRMKRGQDPFHR